MPMLPACLVPRSRFQLSSTYDFSTEAGSSGGTAPPELSGVWGLNGSVMMLPQTILSPGGQCVFGTIIHDALYLGGRGMVEWDVVVSGKGLKIECLVIACPGIIGGVLMARLRRWGALYFFLSAKICAIYHELTLRRS